MRSGTVVTFRLRYRLALTLHPCCVQIMNSRNWLARGEFGCNMARSFLTTRSTNITYSAFASGTYTGALPKAECCHGPLWQVRRYWRAELAAFQNMLARASPGSSWIRPTIPRQFLR